MLSGAITTLSHGRHYEIATSAPGYNSLRPNPARRSLKILKLNGYSTAQFGSATSTSF